MPLKKLFASLMTISTRYEASAWLLKKNLPLKWRGIALADSLDGAVDSDNTVLRLTCVHFKEHTGVPDMLYYCLSSKQD